MTTAFIPVLMSDIKQLTQPVDIMKYIIWEYTSIPKNINDTFNEKEISFIFDAASVDGDPEALSNTVRGNLSGILSSYFPTGTNSVDVEVEWVDSVRYNLTIDMLVVINSTPYRITNTFQVDKSGNLVLNLIGN